MYNLTKILLFTLALVGPAYASEVLPAENSAQTVDKITTRCECAGARNNRVKARLGKFAGEGLENNATSLEYHKEGPPNLSGFTFKVKGSNDFSLAHARNRQAFQVSRESQKINVLIKDGKNEEDGYPGNANDITGVAAVNGGGVKGNYLRDVELFNDHRLSIEARRSMGNLSYGGLLEAQFGEAAIPVTQNAYVFFETGYGRFEMGRIQNSAVEPMRITASSVAAVGAGLDREEWIELANLEGRPRDASYDSSTKNKSTRHMDVQHPFLISPYSYETTGFTPTRVNFVTTSMNNLQLALGYTNSINHNKHRNIVDFGANYSGMRKSLKYAVSFSGQGEMSPTKDSLYHPLKRLEVGAMSQLRNIKLALSVGNNFLSGVEKNKNMSLDLTKASNANEQFVDTDGSSIYLTFGAAFEEGPVAFSVNYLESQNVLAKEVGVSNFRVVSLGTHYRITGEAYELTPYINARCFVTQEANVDLQDNNKGFILTSGVKVSY